MTAPSNWTVLNGSTCFFCQCIRAALPQTRPTTQIRIPLFPSAPFFFPAPSFSHKGSLETRLRSVHWIWHFEAPHFPVPCPAPGSFLPEIRLSDFPQNTPSSAVPGLCRKVSRSRKHPVGCIPCIPETTDKIISSPKADYPALPSVTPLSPPWT